MSLVELGHCTITGSRGISSLHLRNCGSPMIGEVSLVRNLAVGISREVPFP